MTRLHAPLPAFFLTLMPATPSHFFAWKAFLSTPSQLNSEQVSPPPGNSPLQCSVLPEDDSGIAVLSTCYTYLFMPLSPSLDCKLLKGGDHVLLIFATTQCYQNLDITLFTRCLLNLIQSHAI